MDQHEARLAAETSSICEAKGIHYRAIGVQYMKNSRGIMQTSIILTDLRANSIRYAPIEESTVVRWNLLPEIVEKRLAQYRASG